jgi:hypothetical protein
MTQVDIYALAIILCELLVPFKTEQEKSRTIEKLKTFDYRPRLVEEELTKAMLSHHPEERPGAGS